MTIRDEIKQVLQDNLKPLEQCGFVIKYEDTMWGFEETVDIKISHPFHHRVQLPYTGARSVEEAQRITAERVMREYFDSLTHYIEHS